MVERRIQFQSPDEIVEFCTICQGLEADVDVKGMELRNIQIDGKSLMGLLTIPLGEKLRMCVDGEEENQVDEYFSGYYISQEK